MTYHVSYYAVRGVILECSIYDGAAPIASWFSDGLPKHCKGCVRYERRSAATPDGRGLIAIALCAITIAAVLIAIPTRSWRSAGPPTPDPLAPGLAALSDQQLADLLPKRAEFPASWTVKDEHSRPTRSGTQRSSRSATVWS